MAIAELKKWEVFMIWGEAAYCSNTFGASKVNLRGRILCSGCTVAVETSYSMIMLDIVSFGI